MRLPALTRAGRAQRSADVLARAILAAETPEQAERFRRGYQWASARAAARTRTDVPIGIGEHVRAALRRYRWLLLFLAVGLPLEVVFIRTAPAWLVADARWLAVGFLVGSLVRGFLDRRAARHADVDAPGCGCPSCPECGETDE